MRHKTSWLGRGLGLPLLLVLLLAGPSASASEKAPGAPEPAKLAVSGLGWWRNRELRQSLELLIGEQRGSTLDANTIEDAVFLSFSALNAEGFLHPKIKVQIVDTEEEERTFGFTDTLTSLLPRPLTARSVKFRIEPGVRSTVETVKLTGLAALDEAEAVRYFRRGAGLFGGAKERAYSPARLRRAADQLQERLRQEGYAEATVTLGSVQADDPEGHVIVNAAIEEGALWRVRVVTPAVEPTAEVNLKKLGDFEGRPWSMLLRQNAAETVRQAYYETGYPDVRVDIVPAVVAAPVKNERAVEVTAKIEPGPRVKLGTVSFKGAEHTRETVLRHRVKAQPGDWLDPRAMERTRYRLARLGIFSTVELDYEPATGVERSAVFTLREAPRWETNFLIGYGSYEQLRGGIEWRQFNLFGRAHQTRLELVQSMKSTRGEYAYTVPELFGQSLDGTATLFGLIREEEAFVREEHGGTAAVRRRVPWIEAEGSLGYTYQALNNSDNELAVAGTAENVVVASVDIGLTRDTRDNPLRPRRGYRWFTQLELASKTLGGEVDYQRLEVGAAYHSSWTDDRWVHLGLTHGVVTTLGGADDTALPVNKRFYAGGDSSIRGYQSGEAAPRAADGRFLGAKTYTLLNLEIEQALTKTWSVVVFGDALAQSARLENYPSAEELFTVGLGLRYQTIIGPIRAEYGRNLNPRPLDPGGTLHFSVGFPF